MKMGKFNVRFAVAVAAAVVAASSPAFAQSASGWEEPALKVIEVLESGFVKIASLVIGIGIIGLGAWGALTAKLDFMRFAMIFIGGLLVVAGPTMLRNLLSAVGN
jgi:conjugal transfer pilus assembly protein TraA|tara:strand:- start:44545 stop:44859 length:315 start_codon:yes stop_codon:yes gene_type:complete